MTATKKNKKRISALLSLLVVMLSGLFMTVPIISANADTGTDIIKKGDYYVFSSETATRFWLDIPLSNVTGYFNYMAKQQITQANGFKKDRTDYKGIAVQIRLDSVKYESMPIMLMGNVDVNMRGYKLQDIFYIDKCEVNFKSNLKIYLFLGAYNHLTKYKENLGDMTITLYMNGSGLRVDSQPSTSWNDGKTINAFAISGATLDLEPYDPEEDNPDSDKYKPPVVTDPTSPDPPKKSNPKAPFNLFESLADLFGTTKNNVIAVFFLACCGIGALIVIGNVKPK